MTTFLLIRHAETDAINNVLAGWTPGWPLNKAGSTSAAQLADELAPVALKAIYCSPLDRTLETALMVAAPHSLVPEIRDSLGEFHFGRWEGKSFDELHGDEEWVRFNRARSMIGAPGGELMSEVQARILRETEDIRSRHADEIVAIVSHGDPIRALVCHYLGCPLDMSHRMDISLASVTAVRFQHDIPKLVFLNRTSVSALLL